MGTTKKAELDSRLEAYFATRRTVSLREILKHSAENWQVYAAVTGSALAMATGASAAIIHGDTAGNATDAIARVMAANPRLASSKDIPLVNAVRLAIARQKLGDEVVTPMGMTANQTAAVTSPSISPGGIVPLYGTTSVIQPGEWVSIFGTNLAAGTAIWNGNFPTELGGTSVTIDGKAAYLEFVSPGQINLQAPDDTVTGTVEVVVTTASGSATSTVTLNAFAPSFSLLDAQHVAAIIVRTDGSGAYGNGSYDILGPTGNSLGYPTVAANPGDVVEVYGVGFGPTSPAVAAGEAFSGAAPVAHEIKLYINSVRVKPSFVGLSSAGLYQINLVVPSGLGAGDVSILAVAGGVETQGNALFSLSSATEVGGGTGIVNGGGTIASSFFRTSFNSGGNMGTGGNNLGTGGGTGGNNGGTGGGAGTGGGGGTGGGTGGDVKHPKKPYHPRLNFGSA